MAAAKNWRSLGLKEGTEEGRMEGRRKEGIEEGRKEELRKEGRD